MSIPGLSTLKTWGLVALSIIAAVVFALFRSEQAGRAKEKLQGEINARKTGRETNKAIMDGLNDEQAAVDKARNADPSDRSGFE